MDLQDIEYLDQRQKLLDKAGDNEDVINLMEIIDGAYMAMNDLENADYEENEGLSRSELMGQIAGILIETSTMIFESMEAAVELIEEAHTFYLIQAQKTGDKEFTEYALNYSDRMVALKELIGFNTVGDILMRELVKGKDYTDLSDSDEDKQE